MPGTSDEKITTEKTGRDHHLVKYKQTGPSRISGGDFFVIFGRQGKDMRKTSNLKFQMGITGVPFGRTEVLVPPPEPHERALARGKGPKGPGIRGFRKTCEHVIFFAMFLILVLKKMKMR